MDLSTKKDLLKKTLEKLDQLVDWSAIKIGEKMMEVVKENTYKTGEYFMTMRVAITGKRISPPLNESMEILGKKECLKRVKMKINSRFPASGDRSLL
ncbi:MAG: Glutamate-tRNA ligase [Candidatus Roizmanbacteria bacterium GW2011_GWC2_35_12]|uniref:Glutamate-tRNA ligase n=2 Tax=Candidatus Roizmaniibacteriota TaxID=1752723 RepID=A0A0G0BE62_9BACT|nr:MAG: Glutamate-tRNA ligase [Candidatus Roizmanbacteria bacterium GW2011_GWC2_35_12]